MGPARPRGSLRQEAGDHRYVSLRQGGGGLVADSKADEEYTETLDKIRHLIGALE